MTEGSSKKKKLISMSKLTPACSVLVSYYILFSLLFLFPSCVGKITCFRLEMEGGKENKYFPRIAHNTGIKGNDIHTPSTSVSQWQNEFNEISPLPQSLLEGSIR